MAKLLDLDQSIWNLVHQYPEAVEILASLGFENITNPAMLNTAGRIMTLRKGSAMKQVPLDKILQVFKERGFNIKEE